LTHYYLGQVTTAKLGPRCVTNPKIALNAVDSTEIIDDTIVDADINAAAAIARSKLALPALTDLIASDYTAANTNNVAWTTLYTRALSNAEATRTRIIVTAQIRGNAAGSAIATGSALLRVFANGAQRGQIVTFSVQSTAGTATTNSGGVLRIALIAGVDYTSGTGFSIAIEGIVVSLGGGGAIAYYDSSTIEGVE
jgi:hypothetical protein